MLTKSQIKKIVDELKENDRKIKELFLEREKIVEHLDSYEKNEQVWNALFKDKQSHYGI